MKFKEFVEWCNQRACDGCWGMNTAMFCIETIRDVRKQPFWKREKYWHDINRELQVEEKVVIPINAKIKEIYG